MQKNEAIKRRDSNPHLWNSATDLPLNLLSSNNIYCF